MQEMRGAMAEGSGAVADAGPKIEVPDSVKKTRTYALVILTLAYTSSYLDRTIIGAVAGLWSSSGLGRPTISPPETSCARRCMS